MTPGAQQVSYNTLEFSIMPSPLSSNIILLFEFNVLQVSVIPVTPTEHASFDLIILEDATDDFCHFQFLD